MTPAEREQELKKMEDAAKQQEDDRFASLLKRDKEIENERVEFLNRKQTTARHFIHDTEKKTLYDDLGTRITRRQGKLQKGNFSDSKFLDR